ncbi:hypothetical protein QWY77_06405 [Thalassotalea ponticola]|uniref:hypothetical protein n=1 Tax=Thalassotalea ponticola TaxID=1523392 RepID=UPI0025B3B36E|nr:hypothetical protein [Thalassotalea ponticola]MDN3652393.1 hypothetical protein [Thalassotalea ponticola]
MRPILLTVALLTCSSAFAFDSQRWLDCSNINNNDDRLACYDRVANSLKSEPTSAPSATDPVPEAVAPAPTVTTATAATAAATNAASDTAQGSVQAGFGLEHKMTEQEQAVDALTMTISKAKQSLHGEWTLWFENGQQWRTLSNKRIKFKAGQEVVISRGIFNSFTISAVDSNRTTKIKRLN